ncbi:MAG: cadherin repeat domain-containing protein, partial [Sphaerospermopsis kisseleviana]
MTWGADKHLFTLNANGELTFNQSPDFENPLDGDKNNTHQVETTAHDNFGEPATTVLRGTTVRMVTITVNNVNETPTNLALNATTINENVNPNTVIGTFSSTDPDTGNTFTYSLVAGAGDTDNTAFSIVGNQLQINNSPNFETKNSYSIRVKTTDQGGLEFEKTFVVNINDLNEAPTNLALSATTVNENVVSNTVIGTFSSTTSNMREILKIKKSRPGRT